MVYYLYKSIEEMKDEYENLESVGIKVTKLYNKYLYRARKNVKQIETLYGRRLQHTILQQKELDRNFALLNQVLDEIEDRISGQISEHDDKIETYLDDIYSIKSIVNDISNELSTLIDETSK